jgi:hypothetical protein
MHHQQKPRLDTALLIIDNNTYQLAYGLHPSINPLFLPELL